MKTAFQLSGARIGFTVVAALIEILLPIALGLLARRRLVVSWRYFGYGALIFLLFQLITRVPLVQIIQAQIAPQLQADRTLLIAWIVILSLTAGLFEEVGRYVGYRWLMKREEKTWAKGVMYGLGHGGLESMLLIGGLVLLGLINLLALSAMNIDALQLSPEQRAQLDQQLAAIQAQPDWLPLVGAWERLWALAMHVGLSVVVLQVFRRGSLSWLWIAIAAHALADLLGAGLPTLLSLKGTAALAVPEAIVAISGLLGLWAIWALRDRPADQGSGAGAEAALVDNDEAVIRIENRE